MAYDWERLMGREPAGSSFQQPPGVQKRDPRREIPGFEELTIYGNDIRSTRPPAVTGRAAAGQSVVFESPDGERFALGDELLSKHLMMLGGIGTGKTNTFNFLVEALLEKLTGQDIVFIFDTKGDFLREFYRPNDSRHIVIGNSDQYRSISRYWDIFGELIDPDGRFTANSELTAKEIAMQLFAGRESQTQPFFSMAAADLVCKVLCDFMRNKPGRLSNERLVEFWKKARVKEYFELTERNEDFRSAQLYFGDPNKAMTAQALGVFGYINAMVNDLFVGIFSETRGTAPFSMRRLVREKGGRVVFLEYDLSVGEVLGPIYRILIDLALKEALGRTSGAKGNVYLIIDEFKLLPNLLHIDDALNFGRSLGVKVCAGLQSINQLYDIYGEERGKTLAAGFMNSFCFQTWDCDSRQFITDRFGKNYSSISYRPMNEPTTVQREGHVVEDWDILELGIGEAFVNLAGERPFKFQFSDFGRPHRIL